MYTYTSVRFGRAHSGHVLCMREREDENDGGWGAVPGEESHESEETLSEDERGEPPEPPEYVEPAES